jgi:anti-anti-sigma factor
VPSSVIQLHPGFASPCLASCCPKSEVNGAIRVVHLCGELDLNTRIDVHHACLDGANANVAADLGEVTFMDCSAYGGLMSTLHALQTRGGSLMLRHQTGQPQRFLAAVAERFGSSFADLTVRYGTTDGLHGGNG